MEGVGIHDECMPLSTDYGMFHMSDTQIYRDLRPIANPIIEGVASNSGTIDYLSDTKTLPFVAFDYTRGCALFFCGVLGTSAANNVYVYSVEKEEWYFWKMDGCQYFFFGEEDEIYLFAGATTNNPIKLMYGGNYLAWKWESRAVDIDKPHELKWFYEWHVSRANGTWTNRLRCWDGSSTTTHNENTAISPANQLWGKIEISDTSASTSQGSVSSISILFRERRTPRLIQN
jgi:hypothetical protein